MEIEMTSMLEAYEVLAALTARREQYDDGRDPHAAEALDRMIAQFEGTSTHNVLVAE